MNRSTRIILSLALVASLATPAAVRAQSTPTPEKDAAKGSRAVLTLPVWVKADVATRGREADRTVLLLSGHVEMSRGRSRLDADRAIIWIDETASARRGEVVMSVYAEGSVTTLEKGVRTVGPRVFFEWVGSTFTVDDADGYIAERRRGSDAAFVTRAEAVRRAGVIVPAAVPIPAHPGAPAGVVPPGETTGTVLDPARIAQIYGQQQEGPDIKYATEGDYRVTVVTRYPDVVFTDPGSSWGKMEILAESMVIWVNEKKLKEGKRLREAELEIYAEGRVVIHEGNRTIQCERLFYDYRTQRALMIGGPAGRAVVRTFSEKRKVPLYYRAREFRQVSADRYVAKDVIATTCEFGRPEWGIYAGEMDLTTVRKTVTDAQGNETVSETERAEVWHSRFTVGGVPLTYWPHYTMDLDRDRMALRKLRIRNSSRYGFTVLTQWDLYNLGLYENDWSRLLFNYDYYGDRGHGVGLTFEYEKPTFKGDLFGYYINDSGIDKTDLPPPKDDRSRVRWHHRQKLSDHWRLDAELSTISDRQFLNEYWESEDKEDKEQESLLYLRYLKDNRYLGITGQWRLNDYQTQNEQMPGVRYARLGQPVFGDFATYLTQTRFANIRRRFDDDAQDAGLAPADYRSWRFFTEHELQFPFAWAGWKIAPYLNAAYTWYENVVEDGNDRTLLSAGVRASTTWWKIYNIRSRLWDLNRLRHVVTPTVDVFATWVRTKNPGDILQFDEIDALDDTKVIRLGLRQRLQTRRLARNIAPAVVGGDYTCNWMTLDLELDYYPQADKHHGGRSVGPLRVDYLWQVTDRIGLLSKADLRLDRGGNLDTFDLGVAVNRSPRMNVYLGQRYIDVSDSNIFVGVLDYKLDERWTLNLMGQYDFGLGQSNLFRTGFRRRLHRWFLEMVYEYDAGEGDHTFMMILTPQGLPEGRVRFF